MVSLVEICFVLGAIKVLWTLVSYIPSVYNLTLRRPLDITERYGKGTWVVITGCTAGIGEAFSHEFASRGFNIVLLSRSKAKLEKVDADLKKKYPAVRTIIIVADFGNRNDIKFYEDIHEQLKDLDISILINNVGV
jgi:17beta-estradiol 17-dehydrogenase / very-long-chain 3-oxoacyl-CoA reductase